MYFGMGCRRLRWSISFALLALLTGCGAANHGVTATVPSRPVNASVRASSQTPVAGICARQGGSLVTVYLDYASGGTPDPRCSRVEPDQHLEVINRSNRSGNQGKRIIVTWPPFGRRAVAPGNAIVFTQDFGSYLAPGDHILAISIYGGSGAEIFLGR
jgi:hypothetical protein